MKTVSLSGSLRQSVGKKDAKQNREKGFVPCVIYGGKEQIHFSADEREFSKIVFTPETFIININIDGKEYQTVMQDIQYHPVSDKILHVDFLEIFPDKPVKVAIPVVRTGDAPGIVKGGKLVQSIRKLRVKGLASDVPENIEVDISKLDIGDTVKVEELSHEKLEFLNAPSEVIVAVRVTRAAVDEEEEEEEEGDEETPAESSETPAE